MASGRTARRIGAVRALGASAALALLVLAAGLPAAEAAPPPRVEGLICTKALKASAPKNGIWWTVFIGERKGFFDRRETTRMVRCFTSEKTCKAWLYWAQSDWPNFNQWRPCKRGFPY